MPDEQSEPDKIKRESKPSEDRDARSERRAQPRNTYTTEDGENPLICRGID